MKYLFIILYSISLILFSQSCIATKVNPSKIDDLVSFWDFNEEAGNGRKAKRGNNKYTLIEGTKDIEKVNEGVFGPHSANIKEGQWFYIPRSECPALNIHGKNAQVTIVAWIKRGDKNFSQCEAIAGMWNESNKKRQYCLFLDLRIWKSSQQVGGHISGVGGPSEGFKYRMDASIGKTPVPRNEWQCIAFSYDGKEIKSYLNGVLDKRKDQNPYSYDLGIFNGGTDGADFTVGAVDRSGEMGNFFVGHIGGLAVYKRALNEKEILYLSSILK